MSILHPKVDFKPLALNHSENTSERHVLTCPHCGSEYLHHETATVYSRKEDEDRVLETRVDARITECAIVPTKTSLNPSGRRDGLTLTFSCEGCPSRLELVLAQHKGQSLLYWRRAKAVRS